MESKKLPVYLAKREIIQEVKANKTIILISETATGKTTQIPQFLLSAGLERNKCIGITQPRRVAAVTIAKRVAEETNTSLGDLVGYCVRFENVTSNKTKIKYLTEGMLLRETLRDSWLKNYSVIILDEVHERTLNNDILFGIVKSAQKLREEYNLLPLKIIIMSATLDYKPLNIYFDAPVYLIKGREYNIRLFNTASVLEDYIYSALVTVFQIHQNNAEGDILVFCTGQEEIEDMVEEVKKAALGLPAGLPSIIPFPLYAALPPAEQAIIFKPTPPGYRKVIFSTNIAETSITIPGIKYVIDTGMVKSKYFNAESGFDILKVERISKAQAEQRTGRAGRESNGFCYRLYTIEEYNAFKEYPIPEIQRSSLSNVILQMIAIGIDNVYDFDFLDRPSEENIDASLNELLFLDAITIEDGKLLLTDCGRKMVIFPLEPRFSKMILTSKTYRCTDEILSIISLLSVESIFFSPPAMREKFFDTRKKFESSEGDHIMLLNAYKMFIHNKSDMNWCLENFIQYNNMKKARAIRKQLYQLCQQVDIPACSSNGDTKSIRKCLATGLFMNTVLLYKNKVYKMIDGNEKVRIHPLSCLFKSQPSCCIYTELVQTSRFYIKNVTYIQEDWLSEIAPDYFKDKNIEGFNLISVDDNEES